MRLNEIKIWKLNILDITLLFIILLCVVLFYTNKSKATVEIETENQNAISKFSYVVLISGVSNTTGEVIKVGDELYDKATSSPMGKITNIKTSSAIGYLKTNSGDVLAKEIPGKLDIELTIETQGSVKDGEYYANNIIRILAGSSKQLKTKYVMFIGEIIDFVNV